MAQKANGDYYYVESETINDLMDDFGFYQTGTDMKLHDEANDEEAGYVAGAGWDAPASRGYHVGGTQVVGPQQQAYTTANVAADTDLDADNDTVATVADVLGTLIQDLQTHGLIQ